MKCVILKRVINDERSYNVVVRDTGGQTHVMALDWWYVKAEGMWTLSVFHAGVNDGAGELLRFKHSDFGDLANQVRDETEGQLDISWQQ